MRKSFLLLLFTAALSIRAQVKPFSFGFLFTANATSFNAKPGIGEISPQLAYGGSAFARVKILILYAEMEAGFTGHKLNSTQTSAGLAYSSNYSFSGLDVSGILGWRVIGIGPLGNFRIFGGYNIANFSKITVETNGSSVTNPGINTGNGSFLLGTGVDLWRIVFNLKYNIGTSDLSTLSTQELKANFASISIGFRF